MKILIWAVSAILGMLVAALAFVYFSPDYNLYTVRSESMVPAIRMGDMVLTGPPGGPFNGGLVAGTVITFTRGNETVTHRILSVENGFYRECIENQLALFLGQPIIFWC
jgi:signal peptidase I